MAQSLEERPSSPPWTRFALGAYMHNGLVRVVPVGDLDLATASGLERRLEDLRGRAEDLVLDLRQLSFIDSTGLHLVITWCRRAAAEGFRFGVVQGGPDIQRLFEITRLLDELPFVAPPSDAGRPLA